MNNQRAQSTETDMPFIGASIYYMQLTTRKIQTIIASLKT